MSYRKKLKDEDIERLLKGGLPVPVQEALQYLYHRLKELKESGQSGGRRLRRLEKNKE